MILPFPVTGVEAGVVEEAGSVSVYEGAEGEAVSPAGGHVPDVEAGVGGQLPPAPLLQGRHTHHAADLGTCEPSQHSTAANKIVEKREVLFL